MEINKIKNNAITFSIIVCAYARRNNFKMRKKSLRKECECTHFASVNAHILQTIMFLCALHKVLIYYVLDMTLKLIIDKSHPATSEILGCVGAGRGSVFLDILKLVLLFTD